MQILHRKIKRIIPIFEVTAVSANNQPANDDIELISDSASDTQQITVLYYDNSDILHQVTTTLDGVTQVVVTSAVKPKTFLGAYLGDEKGNISARAVGTITIREASGNQAIATIAAGKLSTGMAHFIAKGEDVVIENIAGNTWFNTLGMASTTGASGQLTGRMSMDVQVPSDKFISLISDAVGSTVQIYVLDFGT
jgi:hypothetical protein